MIVYTYLYLTAILNIAGELNGVYLFFETQRNEPYSQKKVSGLLMLYNAEAGKYSSGLNIPANSELLGMQEYIKLGPSWHFLPFTASYNLAL